MEFTPELSAFQGIITTADSAYSFSELKSKGGNEEKIKYVVDCLRRFLQREGYIQENNVSQGKAHTVRKFAFYICLNSDLPILEELVDLDGIAFLIWTVPVIRKCLMCEILWKLHMEKFIYEMLVFTCPLLSLEVAEALLDHFKYFDPTECLQNLKLLSLGCYRMICRLIFFELEGDEITRSYNNFQKCLKYFSEPPNVSKLGRLSEDDEYKYIGRRLYEMLLLISDCFTYYIIPQQFKPADFQDIYELSYLDGIVINEQLSVSMSQSSNSDILECINNCNTALLDTCQTLAMEVSVDIFCAWSEFEENGRSMQQTIGELCYNVHTQLSKISSVSGHPVVAMLQLISCKPKDLVEVINNSDTSVIMEKISKEDNEGSQWIKALIYKDNLCQNLNLIEKIASHLHILNEFECCKLFKIIYTYLQDNNMENREMFLSLAMKVFQRCSSSSKHEIVDEHYSDASFNNNLETTEFSNMVTETFNKLIISTDADLSDVLTVFIQNPRSVYRKIFHLASVNTHQADIMFKVMKCLEKYSKHYYKEETEPCIIQVTKEVIAGDLDTESNQDNFIGFLKNLKFAKAIPAPKLLLLIIMPNLHSGLLNKNFTQICIQCKLLQAAYNIEELVEYRAPALAMLAQVLDTVRWKMDTYVVQAPSTLELVLQLQTALYTSDLTGKESTWLKSKLRNINPLNMYYFRKLWNPPGNTFVEVVSGMHIHKEMDIEHLSLWLSQTLSSTILQEWYQIWDSLCSVFGSANTLDRFHDALLLLCVAEKSNHTESTRACLLYCVQNFVLTTRYKFFKTTIIGIQATTVFDKFAVIENIANESDIEEIANLCLPLFAYLAEKKEDLFLDPNTLVTKFKHKAFTDIIRNLFMIKSDTEK